MDVNLRECPFCGNEYAPRLMRRYGVNGWRDRYYVLCEYDTGGCGAESGWYHSPREAVAAWNTRDGQAE